MSAPGWGDTQARAVPLAEWNNTAVSYPSGTCVHELFEAQVKKTPDAIAVVFSDQYLRNL